MLWFQENETYV